MEEPLWITDTPIGGDQTGLGITQGNLKDEGQEIGEAWTSEASCGRVLLLPDEQTKLAEEAVLQLDELEGGHSLPLDQTYETVIAPYPSPSLEDAMSSLRRARSVFTLSPPLASTSTTSFSQSFPHSDEPVSGDSIFSWSRWYPTLKAPTPQPQDGEDVARLVRAALRRRREGEGAGSASLNASLSAEEADRLTLSPTSSAGTWEQEVSESEGFSSSSGTSSLASSLSSTTSSTSAKRRELRATQSAATLKAVRHATSKTTLSASVISREGAQVALYSPSSPNFALPSPAFSLSSTTASSSFSPIMAAFPSPPSVFFASHSASVTPDPAAPEVQPLSVSFSSRLRRAASNLTLRRRSSSVSSSFAPSSSSAGPLPPVPILPVEAKLRELLLAHDSRSDPPPLPDLSASFPTHTSLDSLVSTSSSSSSASSGNSAFEVERQLFGRDRASEGTADDVPPSPAESEEDPFAPYPPCFTLPPGSSAYPTSTSGTHSHQSPPSQAWMSPSSPVISTIPLPSTTPTSEVQEGGIEDDDIFADADSISVSSTPTSPLSPFSSQFPPFDPIISTLPPSSQRPQPPLVAPVPPKPTQRPRVLTKQRSFVDPRTRKLRTAPGVVLTPSTPPVKRGTYLTGATSGRTRA
ncbi:hypothetical protein JCM11641_000848 [Rhodosporidiobolus odoratus]